MATITAIGDLAVGDLVKCKRSFLDPWKEGYIESLQLRPREIGVRCGRRLVIITKKGKVKKLHGAEMVEAQARVAEFLPSAGALLPELGPPVLRLVRTEAEPVLRPQPKVPRPVRDKEHLAQVRKERCCSCKRPGPSDPHHFGPRGVGKKGSDHLVVPLCREEHERVTDGLPLQGLDKEGMEALFYREAARLLSARVEALREGRAEAEERLVVVPLQRWGCA